MRHSRPRQCGRSNFAVTIQMTKRGIACSFRNRIVVQTPRHVCVGRRLAASVEARRTTDCVKSDHIHAVHAFIHRERTTLGEREGFRSSVGEPPSSGRHSFIRRFLPSWTVTYSQVRGLMRSWNATTTDVSGLWWREESRVRYHRGGGRGACVRVCDPSMPLQWSSHAVVRVSLIWTVVVWWPRRGIRVAIRLRCGALLVTSSCARGFACVKPHALIRQSHAPDYYKPANNGFRR